MPGPLLWLLCSRAARADGCGVQAPAEFLSPVPSADLPATAALVVFGASSGAPELIHQDSATRLEVRELGFEPPFACNRVYLVLPPSGGWPVGVEVRVQLDSMGEPGVGDNGERAFTAVDAPVSPPVFSIASSDFEAVDGITAFDGSCCHEGTRTTVALELGPSAAEPWAFGALRSAHGRADPDALVDSPSGTIVGLFPTHDETASVTWDAWEADGVLHHECMDVGLLAADGTEAWDTVCVDAGGGCGCEGTRAPPVAALGVLAGLFVRRRGCSPRGKIWRPGADRWSSLA